MDPFGSIPTMSSTVPVVDPLGLSPGDLVGRPLTMESFDQDLHFDDFVIDAVHQSATSLPQHYDLESYAALDDPSAFEEPFYYDDRPTSFPSHADQAAFHDEESPAVLDNDLKLLGFSAPTQKIMVVDEGGQFAEVGMTAELCGMFFVAEDVFTGEGTGRPLELTCYRRNLWQCLGQITVPRVISHLVDEQGQNVPIVELSASVCATESIDGKQTEIISIPWKSSNAAISEDAKVVATGPPNLVVDPLTGSDVDASRVSLPISWKRLQFKHATANNGRRKGLQQHYVVEISLLGKTKTGGSIKIADIKSGPVIVRGRSPRNFDSRKDVPLSNDKRKLGSLDATATTKGEKGTPQAQQQRLDSVSAPTPQPSSKDWAMPQPYIPPNQSPHPAKRLAASPSPQRPPLPGWGKDLTTSTILPTSHTAQGRTMSSVPINLSLSEDERSPNQNSTDLQSPPLLNNSTTSGPGNADTQAENTDLLYEYFPLSVDDWMPPVDAVYRPHFVHHAAMSTEVKAQQIRSKMKRYFVSE